MDDCRGRGWPAAPALGPYPYVTSGTGTVKIDLSDPKANASEPPSRVANRMPDQKPAPSPVDGGLTRPAAFAERNEDSRAPGPTQPTAPGAPLLPRGQARHLLPQPRSAFIRPMRIWTERSLSTAKQSGWNPDDPILRISLGIVLSERGSQTRRSFTYARPSDSSLTLPMPTTCWLGRWPLIPIPDGEIMRKLSFTRRAAELDPHNLHIQNTLGFVELRNGNLREAESALRKPMEKGSASPDDWFPMAILCARKGLRDEARRWFDQAVASIRKNNTWIGAGTRSLWAQAAEELGEPGPGSTGQGAAEVVGKPVDQESNVKVTPSVLTPRLQPLGSIKNPIGMTLSLIPAGSFEMGSNDEEDSKPIHTVRITKSFYMATHEVTQRQYRQVMGVNPSRCKPAGFESPNNDDLPVESNTWIDAIRFCNRLTPGSGSPPVMRSAARRSASGAGRAIDCRPRQNGSTHAVRAILAFIASGMT